MQKKRNDLGDNKNFDNGSRSEGIPPANLSGELTYKTMINLFPVRLTISANRFSRFIAPSGFTSQVWAVRDSPAYTLINPGMDTEINLGKHVLSLTFSASNLTDINFYLFGTRIPCIGRKFNYVLRYTP